MFPDLTAHASRRPKAAMPRQPYVNFGYGRIAIAPAPPVTGTALTLQTGHGSRFPAPPFEASVWAYAQPPDPDSAEVVTVLAVQGDTFTVVRAQQQTRARVIVAGDQISANVTAGNMNAIGFWRDVDIADTSMYGVAIGDPNGPFPQTGLWTPAAGGSYTYADIGVGTIALNFLLWGTTLTQNLEAGSVFALRLPTSDLGQARARYGAFAVGFVSITGLIGGAWVNPEQEWLRFGVDNMKGGTYNIAGNVTVPCDWW